MRWERVSERKEKHPEIKQLLRQKKNKTKQNRIKCVGEENKPQWLQREGIVPGSQAAEEKKEEKNLSEKKILIRRRRIKAEKAHQDVQSEAVRSWKVQICNSFKLAN